MNENMAVEFLVVVLVYVGIFIVGFSTNSILGAIDRMMDERLALFRLPSAESM